MRLATCEIDGKERWGIVLRHPIRDEDWIFYPQDCEEVFMACAANRTNGMYGALRRFAPKGEGNAHEWPKTLRDFLALGEAGMEALRALERHLCVFLARGDRFAAETAGRPLTQVRLCAPIPRPRLMWGLVQNSPSFWRKNPQRHIANFMPQGHQRPIGSIIGEGGIWESACGFNVELGVIIGKRGRNIPVEQAMEYVAGYTVIIDGQINSFYERYFQQPGETAAQMHARYDDWYLDATCSWGGKMANAHCAVGPWIVTEDEVGDVYDLLVYTLQDGTVRDRSHTAGMSIGVERTIHFYASFATLEPGDIIHMGTMGTDGIFIAPGTRLGSESRFLAEIERIGRLSVRVLDTERGVDWREEKERQLPISPAERYYNVQGLDVLKEPWDVCKARHAFLCFGNCCDSERMEGMKPTPFPRFLSAPASCLGQGGPIALAPRAGRVALDMQLAFVVKKLTYRVQPAQADDYILGYCTAVCATDLSIRDQIVEPATPQERALSCVYGRWGDGYNVLGPLRSAPKSSACAFLEIEGMEPVQAEMSDYRHTPAQILSFISQGITLFPGDVVLCGRLGAQVFLSKEQHTQGLQIRAQIDGLMEVTTRICH